MNTVIKFVAAAARPELFEQEGYSFEYENKSYFPGWSLKEIKRSENTRTISLEPGIGFNAIFGDLAEEYGVPPAIDETGTIRFDWWNFERNEYVYFSGRDAKPKDKPEREVERDNRGYNLPMVGPYFPPPDPNQKPDSLKNMNRRAAIVTGKQGK